LPADGSPEGGGVVRAAARNNAEWCDAVCRSHGVPGRFDADAWVNPRRTPRYYPDAVTLDPTATAEAILPRIDTTSPGCSIKDSFATLELERFGFRVLHEAEWIYRAMPPATIVRLPTIEWTAIDTADALVDWEAAWAADDSDERLFLPGLLQDPAVTILGGRLNGAMVEGAIVNRTGTDLVGLSNLYARSGDLNAAWGGALAYLDTAIPGVGVVGYESGSDLAAAIRHGFRRVGPLRIWLRESGAP
jgi:hypothetical protein